MIANGTTPMGTMTRVGTLNVEDTARAVKRGNKTLRSSAYSSRKGAITVVREQSAFRAGRYSAAC